MVGAKLRLVRRNSVAGVFWTGLSQRTETLRPRQLVHSVKTFAEQDVVV